MNIPADDRIVELLRSVIPTTPDAPAHDLWPRVRERLAAPPPGPAARDYVLAGAALLACLAQPPLATLLLLLF
jgi:hypothetical protein